MMMRFHAQTAGATLTAQQVDNNVVRVTLQALAAVLGGAQSLHTNSRDEALALPTENSVLLALRTQQLIAHESGRGGHCRPARRLLFLESLTRELEQKALEYLAKIDDIGGAVAAIERGYPQREIQNAAFSISARSRPRNGSSSVSISSPPATRRPRYSEGQSRARGKAETHGRAGARRARRGAAHAALARVEDAARDGANLMPVIIDAVRSWCTLGEIADAMRSVFGEYQPINTL